MEYQYLQRIVREDDLPCRGRCRFDVLRIHVAVPARTVDLLLMAGSAVVMAAPEIVGRLRAGFCCRVAVETGNAVFLDMQLM